MIDLKKPYPIELAGYHIVQNLDDEPTFAWWVPFIWKKRDQIIAALKQPRKKHTHKYGIYSYDSERGLSHGHSE